MKIMSFFGYMEHRFLVYKNDQGTINNLPFVLHPSCENNAT